MKNIYFLIALIILIGIGYVVYQQQKVNFIPVTNEYYINNTKTEIVKTLGSPSSFINFKISDTTMYEYRMGLYDKFSTEEIENGVDILECIWIDGDVKTVVWFTSKENNQYVAIDNLSWNQSKIKF